MRLSFRLTCLMLSVSVGMSLIAQAIPVPSLDLDELTDRATVIALGEVTKIQEQGTEDLQINGIHLRARVALGQIRVDHLLKGSSPANVLIFRFHLMDQPIGWGSVKEHSYGVFFLAENSTGTFEFASPYYPWL